MVGVAAPALKDRLLLLAMGESIAGNWLMDPINLDQLEEGWWGESLDDLNAAFGVFKKQHSASMLLLTEYRGSVSSQWSFYWKQCSRVGLILEALIHHCAGRSVGEKVLAAHDAVAKLSVSTENAEAFAVRYLEHAFLVSPLDDGVIGDLCHAADQASLELARKALAEAIAEEWVELRRMVALGSFRCQADFSRWDAIRDRVARMSRMMDCASCAVGVKIANEFRTQTFSQVNQAPERSEESVTLTG